MVRRLILTTLLVIMLIGLLAGCGEKEEEAAREWGLLPVEKMEVKVNEEFTIAKGFDMNSGFIWREKYDESMVEILGNTVDSDTREDGTVVLYQVFRFQAKKKGNTQIFLANTRSTLEGPVVSEQVVYDIYIK
jgi:predicted secreted protein